MSRFKFYDIDGNSYTVTDPTFMILEESNPVESDLLQRSFGPGAQNPGILRDTSKEIVFQYETYGTEAEFRTFLNEFLYNMRKAVLLEDTVLEYQIDIEYLNHVTGYGPGGYHKGATNTLTLTGLLPFWENVTETTDTDTATTTVSMAISNTGWIESDPVITLVATAGVVNKFSVRNSVSGRGIIVQDLQFGATLNDTYIIDCKEGTLKLNGVSRESRIKGGTGFFPLPVGASNLEFTVTGAVSITVDYRRRWFV